MKRKIVTKIFKIFLPNGSPLVFDHLFWNLVLESNLVRVPPLVPLPLPGRSGTTLGFLTETKGSPFEVFDHYDHFGGS